MEGAQQSTQQSIKRNSFLYWVERIGNKIPNTFTLFLWLLVLLAVVSTLMHYADISFVFPSTNEVVSIQGILTAEGIEYALTNLVDNFIGFAPLGVVLTMMLGIGVADNTGLFNSALTLSMRNAPAQLVTYIIFVVGMVSNIASDAALVIVPGISGALYYSLGRHPIGGILAGYAAATAGFSANLFIASTDALLSGITNEAAALTGLPAIEVTSNWLAMVISVLVLAVVGTVITERVLLPRLGEYKGEASVDANSNEVTDLEKKGLKYTVIALLIWAGLILAFVLPEGSMFRNPETGSLFQGSLLMASIVPLLFITFLVAGITYGVTVGKIKNTSDAVELMQKTIASSAGFIVVTFAMGQFTAWFNWTNIGAWIAVNLAGAVQAIGWTGPLLFIAFILVVFITNFFLASGSAKWTIFAPIFVPVFGMLGYNPAWTQFLYRIGDSVGNVLSPIGPSIPILLHYMRQYDEDAGIGTIISNAIPYSISFLIVWTLLALVGYYLNLPLGPGTTITL